MMGPDYKNNLDVKTKHELWFSTEDPTLKILTLSPSPYSKYLYSEHDKLKSLLRSLLSILTTQSGASTWSRNSCLMRKWPKGLRSDQLPTMAGPRRDHGAMGASGTPHQTTFYEFHKIYLTSKVGHFIRDGHLAAPLVTNTAAATAWV